MAKAQEEGLQQVVVIIDAEIVALQKNIDRLEIAKAALLGVEAFPEKEAKPKKQKKQRAEKKPRQKKASAVAPGEFVEEVDGIKLKVTEQQQALLQLLEKHEYLSMKLIAPLYDNSISRARNSIEDLRQRLTAHGCKAVIAAYHARGFRLETPEA